MRRTAADFAREAVDPYEIQLKSKKILRPRASHHFTHDERMFVNKAQLKWSKAVESGDNENYPDDETPFFVDLKMRFGKDFDVFWAEAKTWPFDNIRRMVEEIEQHYDPTPADDKDAAADEDSGPGKGRLTSVGS